MSGVEAPPRLDAVRFVRGLYMGLLQREPQQEEVDSWVRGMAGGLAADEVLHRFLSSEEHQRLRAAGRADARRFATLLYPALLNREGQPEEIAGWQRGLEAGLPADEMLAQFVASDEFQSRRNAAGRVDPADAARFVAGLYAALLRREPAPEELRGWTDGMAGGQGPGAVIGQFLASQEYQAARAAERAQASRFVTLLFRLLLEREPGEAEVQERVDAICQGMPLDELLEAFAASEERRRLAPAAPLFVPPGHFYSPIVDPESLRPVFDGARVPASHRLHGIDMHPQAQLATWRRLVPHFARMPFPQERAEGFRYWFRNGAYGIGDASVYFGLLLELRPRKIVEIGSGFSSACALDTIDRFFDHEVEIDFVEPYPALLESLMGSQSRARIRVHGQAVQDVDLALFERLEEGDILFIDSTHVLKTRSDVHFELFEILPRLREGVVVHIHDMFWPFEYPRSWVVDQNRSWNEVYAVRAFLMYQDFFEVLFFNDYFVSAFPEEIRASHPAFLNNTGGALWLRKVRPPSS